MANDVEVKVVSQKGTCGAGHKVGDTWTCGVYTPSGMCAAAYNTVFNYIRVLRMGGSFDWTEDPHAIEVACPDAANPAVFQVKLKK